MRTRLKRLTTRSIVALKRRSDAVIGRLTVLLLKSLRLTDPRRFSDFAAGVARTIGPLLPAHKVGRANLVAAFPEKTPEEIERILAGVWDNLGRYGAEFANLDRLWDYRRDRPNIGRIQVAPILDERFDQMRDDGKPALIFAAHLANWEVPALAAKAGGLPVAVLYRRPNLSAVADAVIKLRAGSMGLMIAGGPEAPFKIADALRQGLHVAMLVDQHYGHGVEVTFFGRTCKANPMLARLARHFDCPIYGTRVIRLPDHRLGLDLTEPIDPPRNGDGDVDIKATMQMITTVIEGWVREHPEQWLWLHRRWRLK